MPPPISAILLAVWCGVRTGRRVIKALPLGIWPTLEKMRVTIASLGQARPGDSNP